MKRTWVRWSFSFAALGIAIGASLVLLYPYFRGPVFRLMWLDHLCVMAASGATSILFRGERIAYPWLKDVTFFNIIFVLVNGLQLGVVGAIAGLVVGHKSRPQAIGNR